MARGFYETFGEDVTNELVEWFNSVEPRLTPDAGPGITPTLPRRVTAALVACATLAILVATLRPAGTTLANGWSVSLDSGEAVKNLLLFIPLGAALALAGIRPLRAIAIGAGLSLTVEFLQQWIPARNPNVGDLLCNTLSTAIGAGLVRSAPRWLTVPPRRAAWQSLATALAAATLWLGTGWLLAHPGVKTPFTLEHLGDLPHTIGQGWSMIFFFEHAPAWLTRLLDATWIGGWLLGVGYWGRRHPATGAALIVAITTLGAAPALVGLLPTPVREWLGAVAGFALGLWATRRFGALSVD
jgi:hypothetical protein